MILHQCNKNYMLKSRVMAWDKQIVLGQFLLPSPLMQVLKIKIFKKQKNALSEIILHQCTKNYDHLMFRCRRWVMA